VAALTADGQPLSASLGMISFEMVPTVVSCTATHYQFRYDLRDRRTHSKPEWERPWIGTSTGAFGDPLN
jgi:hypothetical protein